MSKEFIWFLGWSALLAAMLFLPVSKLVWTLSVRRQERKQQRKLEEAEIQGQLRRARFISFFLVIIFAVLFNLNVFGIPVMK
ncbi:MAG: hypothetical protein Kow0032_04670 [Methyloligellaceae bacterium]